MVAFRVTKYDPELRHADGSYLRDEWTSVSDVGRIVGGRALELAEYLSAEDSYVHAMRRCLDSAELKSLRIADLELKDIHGGLPAALQSDSRVHQELVREGCEVSGEELDWVIRLALREVIWCRLEGAGGFYVHFGYDYYMYLGSEAGFAVPSMPTGIYLEPFLSPYQRERSD